MTRSTRLLCRSALALLAAWVLGSALLAGIIVYTGTVDEAVRADAIIVLGAALSRDGTPYKALTRRSAHAARLWRDGRAPMIICTGGIGRTVRIPRSEADGCREVLMREGVPRTAIVLEETSRSTEENAGNARAIMAARGWRRAILVSDSYHVFRGSYIARRAGIDVVRSPVPTTAVSSPLFYVLSVLREVMAVEWQLLSIGRPTFVGPLQSIVVVGVR